jgi:hypothetical protein
MKRNAKLRLTLNRETLRNLNPDEARAAQGAAGSDRICVVTESCFVTYCLCLTKTCPTECNQQPYC